MRKICVACRNKKINEASQNQSEIKRQKITRKRQSALLPSSHRQVSTHRKLEQLIGTLIQLEMLIWMMEAEQIT